MLVVVRRTGLLALLVAVLALLPIPAARASVSVVVVDGRGWGHGVGMAQDGAYWMGQDGATTNEILDHFFPGTQRGSTTGVVRVVALVAADNRVVLDFPQGGELRSPRSGPQRSGFPVQIPAGGAATITYDGTYRVEPAGGAVAAAQVGPTQPVQLPTGSSTTATTLLPPIAPPTTAKPAPPSTTTPTPTTAAPGAPPPTTQAPRPGVTTPEPVWAGPVTGGGTVGVTARGLRYRGEIETSAATGPLRVINEIDIEQYLWGLGEVSASWSPAALGAQMVAARTYALRAMAANGEICDTQRCQVYKGATGEFRGQIDAATATAGTFLSYAGTRYASTVFSANGAGVTATPEEGFGTPNSFHPYLTSAPYDTRSDDIWEVRIGLADLASRLEYPGTATSVRVATKGPSGRPVTIELDGDRGKVAKPALEAARAMGLRSTFWSLRIEASDAAPPPPAAAALIQSAPDNVGAVIAEETKAVVRRHRSAPTAEETAATLPSKPEDDEGHGAVPWLLVSFVVAAGAAGLVVLRRAERVVTPVDS